MGDAMTQFLWMDTIIEDSGEVSQFIMDARAYYVTHHTMRGFGPWQPPVEVNWWSNLTPRFDCYAKDGCKVWKIPTDGDMSQYITDNNLVDKDPWAKEVAGYHMDVWQVFQPTGHAPTWFLVFQNKDMRLVCLAGSTTPSAG